MHDERGVPELTKLNMPNLKHVILSIKIRSMEYSTTSKQKLYFSIFKFLTALKSTLKELQLEMEFNLKPPRPPRLEFRRIVTVNPSPWQLPPDELHQLESNMKEIQLQSFTFKFSKHEGLIQQYNLGE